MIDELSYDQSLPLHSFNIFPKIIKFFDSKTINKRKCSDILLHGKTSNILWFISILISPRNYFIANIFISYKYLRGFLSSPSRVVTAKSFHYIELPISHNVPKYYNINFKFSHNQSKEWQLNLRRCYQYASKFTTICLFHFMIFNTIWQNNFEQIIGISRCMNSLNMFNSISIIIAFQFIEFK